MSSAVARADGSGDKKIVGKETEDWLFIRKEWNTLPAELSR